MIRIIKHNIFLFLAVLAMFCWQNTVYSQTAATQKITTIEGVSEYQLANGLQVLLAPDTAKSQITVNMSYMVGSRHEGPGETGMAHLLEHLLFRGSPQYPDVMAEFSRRGMAANGSTTTDLTNYFATFNSDEDTLKWFLGWLADAMHNASISQNDLNAEMTVVRNELERGQNSPFSSLMQQVNSAAYVWHPYGRSVIGARSDIENVSIRQLRKFYETYYQPNNAVLIITGNFKIDDALTDIEEIFAPMPKGKPIPVEYTAEPVQQGPRFIELERIGGSPIGLIQFHIPSASDDAYTRLALGTAMLADSPAGPLYKKLVDTDQASSVFGFARAMNKPGYTMFGVQIREDKNAKNVLAKLQELISSKTIDELDEVSLKRIKTAWLNDWQQIYNSQSGLAAALSDAVANGNWKLFFIEQERIKAAELNEIKADLKAWLVPNNRTSGLYLPTKDPVYAPANKAANLDKWLAKIKTGTERMAIASFDTNPLAIDQATEVSTLNLPNGQVKIALLPKQSSGQEIHARMSIGFGSVDEFNGLDLVPQITANMLTRGTSKLSRQEISDKLNDLDSDLYFSGQDNILTISMRSSAENFNELLNLSFDILQNATFPENELAKIKSSLLTSINNQSSNPAWLVSNELQRNQQPWAVNDIRYTPDTAQSIQMVKNLSQQKIVDFYNKFYGAGNISFAAVGELDTEAIKNNLSENIEKWQTAPKYQRIPQPWYEIKPKEFKISAPGKANANYLASYSLQLQDDNPDWIPLFLANYLLGGSEDSHLWQSIRSKHGLSYSVGSSIYSSPWEPYAKWTIFASMAPENTVKLADSIKEVLHTTLHNGFTEDEVQQGVRSLLNFLQLGRTSDASLANKWLRYLNLDRNFNWDQKLIERLQELKADDINHVLRKYLDPDGFSVAVAFDENAE